MFTKKIVKKVYNLNYRLSFQMGSNLLNNYLAFSRSRSKYVILNFEYCI